MKKEEVIVTIVNIEKVGQFQHFQIKLPFNTKRVIGIEVGFRWLIPDPDHEIEAYQSGNGSISPPLYFVRNTIIGELKLQSCDASNIFYATELILDRNTNLGASSSQLDPQVFTHQHHALDEPVDVDSDTRIVQGIYHDLLKELPIERHYHVHVYTWIEVE